MFKLRLSSLLILIAGLTLNCPSSAQSPTEVPRPRVVVIAPKGHELLPLLRAELDDLSLEFVEVNPPSKDAPATSPSSLPHQYRIVVKPNHVEVSIVDVATGNVTVREVFTQTDASPLETRTAVLHAVELLRWHQNERSPRSAKRPTQIPVTAPAPSPPPYRPYAWQLTLLPHGFYSPGGMSLGASTSLDASVHSRHFGTRAFASTFVIPNRLTASEGSAEAQPRMLGLELLLLPPRFAAHTHSSFGVGLSLVSTRLRGTTEQAYQPHDDHLLTIAPLIEYRIHQSLSRTFAVVLSTAAIKPLRSASIRFDEREVGRYGTVFLSLGVGLQIALN